jgi:hypothetical protein
VNEQTKYSKVKISVEVLVVAADKSQEQIRRDALSILENSFYCYNRNCNDFYCQKSEHTENDSKIKIKFTSKDVYY